MIRMAVVALLIAISMAGPIACVHQEVRENAPDGRDTATLTGSPSDNSREAVSSANPPSTSKPATDPVGLLKQTIYDLYRRYIVRDPLPPATAAASSKVEAPEEGPISLDTAANEEPETPDGASKVDVSPVQPESARQEERLDVIKPQVFTSTKTSAEEQLYQRCMTASGIAPCDTYLERFPNGDFVAAARERRRVIRSTDEKRLYKRCMGASQPVSCARYLEQFPDGRFVVDVVGRARSLIEAAETQQYQECVIAPDFTPCDSYLSLYPEGRFVAEAKARKKMLLDKRRLSLCLKEKQVDDCKRYLEEYPDDEHRGQIGQVIEDEIWVEAKTSCRSAPYEKYLDAYPNGRYKDLAERALICAEAHREAQEINSFGAYRSYLAVCRPDDPGTNSECISYAEERTSIEFWKSVSETPHSLTQIGDIYKSWGGLREAAHYYDLALSGSDHAAAYIGRGRTHLDSGRREEGIRDLEKAVALKTDDYQPYLWLAQQLEKQSRASRREIELQRSAIDLYSKAIALNPRCAQCYLKRGIIRLTLLEQMEAVSDFKSVLKLSPPYLQNASYKESAKRYLDQLREEY